MARRAKRRAERLRVTIQSAEMRAPEPPGFDQTAARHEITLLTDDPDSRVHPPQCRSCRAIRPFCRKSWLERLQMQLRPARESTRSDDVAAQTPARSPNTTQAGRSAQR